MKILALLSSPRKNGNTAGLLREVLKGANSNGADTEEIFLYEKNIEFCRGCMSCMKTAKCIIKDDFHQIREKIKNADGIVFGSPVYSYTYNAILKNFIDRLGMLEYLTSSALGEKYIVGVSTAGGSIAKKIAKELSYMSYAGVFRRGYSSGYIGVGVKGANISQYPESLKQANLLGQKLVNDIKSRKKYPRQKLFTRIIKNIMLKPMTKKLILKGKDSSTKGIFDTLTSDGVL